MLKAAADREDQSEEGARRRAGSDVGVRGAGRGDKRKRWSVCGAERRGDRELGASWGDGEEGVFCSCIRYSISKAYTA